MHPIFFVIIMLVIIFIFANQSFKKTTYYKDTRNSFIATRFNPGRNGEYLTYKYLKNYERSGDKFLFNCYLPKDDGETTEIDVILISKEGIFAFESKNYSGWIFGDEKSKTWTQSLPKGKGRSHKEHFLNPIMQNKLHIKWLKNLIGDSIPIHSVIVFSERCTLKKVSVESEDIFVIKRNKILSTVEAIKSKQTSKITTEEVDNIYKLLYPYTQITEGMKAQHIDSIVKNQEHLKSKDKKVTSEKQTTNEEVKVEEKPIVSESVCSDNDQQENSAAEIQDNNGVQVNNDVCPKCGSKLVMRTAKKGDNAGNQFWGCSNFPKCRYIMKITE